MMNRQYGISLAAILLVVAAAAELALAQDAPSGTFGKVTPQTKTNVVVIGENPAVRKLDKAGGQAVASAEIFRVTWSPVGAGVLCVVTVRGQTGAAGSLNVAIYDNKALYDYMIKEIRPDYAAYTPVHGSVTQQDSMAGGFSRTETCHTPEHTIKLVWNNLQAPKFTDISMFKNTTQMALNMIPAASGDIVVDGKPAPGTWYEQGGGIGSGAYLTLGETWRR